jgi:NAD-dependent dihydropyrimidine dehydrogenase PreA subunit
VDAEKCIGCGVCLNRCNMDAISIIDNVATINLERCIGCGLCKTTCEAGAISLIKKKKETVPPEDTIKLYRKILYERFGPLGTMKILAKKALRKKV